MHIALTTLAQVFKYTVPWIYGIVKDVLMHPKAALIMMMYVKTMRRNLCDRIAHWMYLRDIEIPDKTALQTLKDNMKDMKRTGMDVITTIGPAAMMEAMGDVVKDAFTNHSGIVGSLVETGVNCIPGGAIVGPIAKSFISTAMNVSGDVMKEAAEMAAMTNQVTNVFTQFLETINIHDCMQSFQDKHALRLQYVEIKS